MAPRLFAVLHVIKPARFASQIELQMEQSILALIVSPLTTNVIFEHGKSGGGDFAES
jgi:hypothetical protein